LSARPVAAAHSRFEHYVEDPIGFAENVLGVSLWYRQREIIAAVHKESRVAVRSGHKVGKSASAAAIALWFASTRPRARVILTAPTHRQIRTILWREIKALYLHSKVPLGGELNEMPEYGLQFADGREVVGFYTNEPEKMAGISGPAVLFIADEASGIPTEIYEAIEGNRAGGARLVMFSNPTQTSGYFFDAFNKKRDYWRCIHVSSEEAAETGIPGLATKEFIDEKRREWGINSPLYQVRIAGNFPEQQSNAVIALGDVERAVARWNEMGEDRSPLVLGVDPARFGDDSSAIVARRGQRVLSVSKVNGQNTHQTGARALEMSRQLRFGPGERPHIRVDSIGIGAGVCDYLRDYHNKGEIVLVEVNVSAPARVEGRYHNLRSELWFKAAEWLRGGGAIPSDGELESELVTPTYNFDLKNRLRVMEKAEIKKILGRSPDKADAFCLAVCPASNGSYSAAFISSRGDHTASGLGTDADDN
jgi:hypothetical protein